MEFKDLLSTYAATAYLRQMEFADLLDDRGWNLDTQNGIVTFGDDMQFQAQILGTFCEEDNSWLWAWANEDSELPDSVKIAAAEMKNFGENNGIEHFSTGHFTLDRDAAEMALVCAGMTDTVYYMGPYEGGAVFFLIYEPPQEVFTPVHNDIAVIKISEIVSNFDVDHKIHVESFLSQQGYEIQEDGRRITGQRGMDKINVEIDSLNRITNIYSGEPSGSVTIQKDPTIAPQFGKIKKLGGDPPPQAPAVEQQTGPPPQPSSGSFGGGPPTPGNVGGGSVDGSSSGGLKLKKDESPAQPVEKAAPASVSSGLKLRKNEGEEDSPEQNLYPDPNDDSEDAYDPDKPRMLDKIFSLGNTFSDKGRKIIIGLVAVLFIVGLVLSFKTFLLNLVFAAVTFLAVRVISLQKGCLTRLGLFPGRIAISTVFSILFIFVVIFYKVWQDQGGSYVQSFQDTEELANKGQEAVKDAVEGAVESIEENTGAETNMASEDIATHEFKYSAKMANSFHDATFLSGGGLLKMYFQYVFLLFSLTLLPFVKARELQNVSPLKENDSHIGWTISRYFLGRVIKSSIITVVFMIGLKVAGFDFVIFIAGITFALGLLTRYAPAAGLIMCLPMIITQFNSGNGFQALIGLAVTGLIVILVESRIHMIMMLLPIKNKQAFIPPVLSQKKQKVKVQTESSAMKIFGIVSFLGTLLVFAVVIFACWKVYSVWSDFDSTNKEVKEFVDKGKVAEIKKAIENNPYSRSHLMALTKASLNAGKFKDMVKAADDYSEFKMPEPGGSGLLGKGEHYVLSFLSKSTTKDKDRDAHEWIVKYFPDKKPELLKSKELLKILVSLQKMDEDNLLMYQTAGNYFLEAKNYFEVRRWCNKGLSHHENDLPLMKLVVRAYIGDKNKSAASKALNAISRAKYHDEEVNDLQRAINKL